MTAADSRGAATMTSTENRTVEWNAAHAAELFGSYWTSDEIVAMRYRYRDGQVLLFHGVSYDETSDSVVATVSTIGGERESLYLGYTDPVEILALLPE